jgi:translation initiation factor 6
LPLYRSNLFGSPNIGVYALTTNTCTILPHGTTTRTSNRFEKYLENATVRTEIGGTRLIGVMAAANTNGIVLPQFVTDDEIATIASFHSGNLQRVDCRLTAFGNLLLANDHGAIASEILADEREAMRRIRETLDVEVAPGRVAGLPYVGSLAVATNTGVLAHPLLTEDEKRLIRDVLKVPVDVGTVNGGLPFIASGLLANDHGAVMGGLTTGPEIVMITSVYGG